MKLYEINAEIEALLDQLEPDPETGEIPANEDEIIARLNTLAMKRGDILEYLAKLALDTKATVLAMKAEEKRLHERRQRAESRQEHLISILDRECGGQKTDLGVATLCYRKSTRVEITDNYSLLSWLKETGHRDCYHQPAPEIYKSAVGKLLDAGEEIPGAERVSNTTCYLR